MPSTPLLQIPEDATYLHPTTDAEVSEYVAMRHPAAVRWSNAFSDILTAEAMREAIRTHPRLAPLTGYARSGDSGYLTAASLRYVATRLRILEEVEDCFLAHARKNLAAVEAEFRR